MAALLLMASLGPGALAAQMPRRLVLPLAPNEHDRVEAVAALPDGAAIAAGWVVRRGDSHTYVLRLRPGGRVDSTFGGPGGLFEVNARPGGEEEKPRGVAIQRDGRIVVAGQIEGTEPESDDFLLLRLTPNGRLDSTFAGGRGILIDHLGGPVDKIRSLVLLPDDRIVVVGHSADAFAVARYSPDGEPDPSFGRDGRMTVKFPGENQGRGVALLGDGSLIVSGYARAGSGRGGATTYVLKVSPSGALDSTWAENGVMRLDLGAAEVRAYVAAATRNGGWVIGGRLRDATGSEDFFVARFDATGKLDRGFGRDGVARIDFDGRDDTVRGLAELADGRIVAAGFSLAGEGSENFAVALLDRGGRADLSLGPGGRRLIDFSSEDDKLRGVTVLPGPVLLLFGHAERGNQRDTAFYWLRP